MSLAPAGKRGFQLHELVKLAVRTKQATAGTVRQGGPLHRAAGREASLAQPRPSWTTGG